MSEHRKKIQLTPWQHKMHEVIFEADTKAGKLFDIVLLIVIVISIAVVMLESVPSIKLKYGAELNITEWILTVIFSIEYIARLVSIGNPFKYMTSFYGVVDLLSILPTYLSIFITGTQSLAVIRSLRLLRIFRILKLAQFMGEANLLLKSLKRSKAKIIVFMFFILSITFILGTLMYIIESPEAGFTSIPRSVYWAIVTMTTVGYGDIAPQTNLGQFVASFIMIIGYAVIAVPTGIVSAEMVKGDMPKISTQACPECSQEGHDADAEHCKYCGAVL